MVRYRTFAGFGREMRSCTARGFVAEVEIQQLVLHV